MIVGELHSGIVSTLAHNSTYTFYLTGSRFFGRATQQSDYDFYAQDTDSLRSYLYMHGFRELPFDQNNIAYKDCEISTVLRKDNVDVQLVSDVTRRLRVNELIKRSMYLVYALYALPKNQRYLIWEYAKQQIAYQTAVGE